MKGSVRKVFLPILISFIAFVAFSFQAMAATALPPSGPKPANFPAIPGSIGDLVEGAAVYDGRRVVIEGEVLGELMFRGSEVWINIGDGPTSAVGVWAPAQMARGIKNIGGYKAKGDWIRVTGVFRRSDPKRGGELDIEAISIEVAQSGEPISHPVTALSLIGTFASVLAAGLLGIYWVRIRRRPHADSIHPN